MPTHTGLLQETTAAIAASCAEHRDSCADVLDQLNQAMASSNALVVPAIEAVAADDVDYSEWTSEDWADAMTH
jgi:hypothetical protein